MAAAGGISTLPAGGAGSPGGWWAGRPTWPEAPRRPGPPRGFRREASPGTWGRTCPRPCKRAARARSSTQRDREAGARAETARPLLHAAQVLVQGDPDRSRVGVVLAGGSRGRGHVFTPFGGSPCSTKPPPFPGYHTLLMRRLRDSLARASAASFSHCHSGVTSIFARSSRDCRILSASSSSSESSDLPAISMKQVRDEHGGHFSTTSLRMRRMGLALDWRCARFPRSTTGSSPVPGGICPKVLPALQPRRNHHRVAGAQPVQRFRAGNQIALLRPPPAQSAAVAPNRAGRGVPGRGGNPLQIAVVEVRGAFPSLKPPAEVVNGHRDALPVKTEGRGSLCRLTVPHRTCPPGTGRPASTPAPPARRGAGRAGKGTRPGREREREAVCTQASTWAGSSTGALGGRGRQALAQLVEFRRVWRKKTFQGGIAQVNHIPLGFLPEPLPGLRQGFAVNRVSPVRPPF